MFVSISLNQKQSSHQQNIGSKQGTITSMCNDEDIVSITKSKLQTKEETVDGGAKNVLNLTLGEVEDVEVKEDYDAEAEEKQ